MFDGDFVAKVASHGWISWQVIWAIVLLVVTAAVGVLAVVRAGQLRRPATAG
jgi:ABC-type multidrug transport system permease subunit